MGFTDNFISWITLLYQEQLSRVKINNHISESFTLNSGVRQGDPLSPLLFVLCIEPLIRSILADPSIKGIKLPDGSAVKISSYAEHRDDEEDIQTIESWLDTYEVPKSILQNRKEYYTR